MSFWEKLLNAIGNTAGNALSAVVEAIRTVFEGDPETRRKVAFSVAIIALSAKMAKADGIVSEKEVKPFAKSSSFRRTRRRMSPGFTISRVRMSPATKLMPNGSPRSALPVRPIARCWKTCSTGSSTSPRPTG